MQTLENRFALGQIDRAEFDHRKAVLDGADTVPPAPANPAPAQAPQADVQPATASDDAESPDPEDEE